MGNVLIKDYRNACICENYILMILDKKDLIWIGWMDKPQVEKKIFLSDKGTRFKEEFYRRNWTHFAYINSDNRLMSETVIKIV